MNPSDENKPTIIAPPVSADTPEPVINQTDVVPAPVTQLEQSPVEDLTPLGSSGAPLRSGYQTPNYGESETDGPGQNIAGVPEEFLHLFEHDSNEIMLEQATRHPIGIVAIFGFAAFAIAMIIAGLVFLASDNTITGLFGFDAASVLSIAGLVAVILVAIIAGGAALAANVYKKSRLILTNQKVVLIQYHSIISREVSQLNIGEVEDVNVSQPTLFDRIFKTGRITIETAGEQNNYVLTQVENPYEFARKTIQMHEGSIAEYGN